MLICCSEITLIRVNLKMSKNKNTLSLVLAALTIAPTAFASNTNHPLDPLSMQSTISLNFNGDAKGEGKLRLTDNLQVRGHLTDEGNYTVGGGLVYRLSENDYWGSGLIRTGISAGIERSDFESIGTRTSLDGSFVVSEYLNRERKILISGSIGGRYLETDYFNVVDTRIQFLGVGSAFYTMDGFYFGSELEAIVDSETQIVATPKIGFSSGNTAFDVGYQVNIKDTSNSDAELTLSATWVF
ncbi:exported hypothetical protein [Vibrio chagasii]|nr:exported hypothetical protein [Vibrio chagasii]